MLLVAIVTGAKADPTTAEIKFDGAGATPSDLFTIVSADANVTTAIQTAPYTYDTENNKSLPAATNYTKLLVTTYAAKDKTVTLTTKDSYTDISNIKVNMATSDKGKTKFKIEVSPKADFSDEVTVVKAEDTFNNNGIGSNNQAKEVSCDLSTTKTGYVRVTLQATNTTKYTAMSYLKITYTEASGPKDPVFSLSESSLQVGETAKILVDGQDIFADNFTAGTLWESAVGGPFISLSADGVVTAVKNTPANYYFHFFGTSKDATKYNSVTSDNLDLTIATKYAISKTTPEHGSIAVSATEASAGDEITLTATPDFKYVLSAWNVYKTGDESTKVTVTNNKFTMPAYAVTVDATFAADPNKQVLYVTGSGSVGNDDQLYSALSEDYTVTVAKYDASISPLTVTNFDLVVLHESIGGSNYNASLVAAAKSGNVPVLNTKAFFYTYNSDSKKNRWGWGIANAGNKELGCTMNAAYSNIADHPIFEGITPGFISVVTGLSTSDKDKAMQPVGTIREGKEGYVLATSLNSDSGNGAAIHELTPAQRGVESAKYLLISLHSECFNKMTSDGIKLFKNAAAYLMSNDSWTPTLATTNITLNTKGFATYSKSNDFTFSGAKAYKMALDETAKTITGTEVTGKIQAGAGILLKGEAGATVTITGATWATALEDNSLKGSTKADGTTATKPEFCYVLSGDTFMNYSGESLTANKAYIQAGSNLANSLDIVFEGNPTAVEAIAETKANAEAPVKVIKNGQLFIGNYNVAGARIK